MKRQLIIYIITIIVCKNSFGQWEQSRFDDRIPAISTFSDLVIKNSEDIFIYDKNVSRSDYYLMSIDGGKTWQRKNITSPIMDEGKRDYLWGLNSVESNSNSDVIISLKYRPPYDLSKMDYLLYRSNDNGNTWQKSDNKLSASTLTWDPTGNNTVGKGESLWYTQSPGNGTVIAVSVGSYILHQGTVYIYKTTDNGITWSKTPVSVNNIAVKANIIPGMRFTDAYRGTLFLSDKYLTTTDGGNTWTENRYPMGDALVMSADILNGQDIYASTGKDVFVFQTGGSVASGIYHTDEDDVYKVKLSSAYVNLLTREGLFLKSPLKATAESILLRKDISLYPNPSVSTITIYSANTIDGNLVSIYDATGKFIEQGKVNGNSITFGTQHLMAGVYYAEVVTMSGQKVAVLEWTKK